MWVRIIRNLNDTVLNNSGNTCLRAQHNKNDYTTVIANIDATPVM